ncbi:MAG: diguanylate cyclase, partial [Spirochaetales bacterium]|nr:diguanylate cyclase [Spirochaetales bacterium]
VLQINDAYARFLGYDKEEIVGRTWKEFTLPEEQSESTKADFLLVSGAKSQINLDKRYRTRDGRIVSGNLTVSNLSIGKDSEEMLGMMVDITARKEYEEKLLRLSTHDSLTNLYNRDHFERTVEGFVVPEGREVAVLLAEVNGLEILNEAFGQNEGNRLLKKVAKILQASTEENDYLARIGGDDFVVILTERTRHEYQAIAKDVSEKLSFVQMPGGMDMSVSVAHAMVDEGDRTLHKAFEAAEKAMKTRKLFEETPIKENLVQTVMTALHVRNKAEEFHSRRVSFLSEQLGRAIGLSESDITQLSLAGLFHDIGKIAVDEEILNKHGELTPEERSEMQRHVEIGYRLLSSVEDMAPIAHIILAHHERIDGGGYPRGIKGEEIPLHARIISIADAYDAMTSTRTYKQQVGSREAARELKACSGTQFDADLAKRFIEEVLFLSYDEL